MTFSNFFIKMSNSAFDFKVPLPSLQRAKSVAFNRSFDHKVLADFIEFVPLDCSEEICQSESESETDVDMSQSESDTAEVSQEPDVWPVQTSASGTL